MSLSNDLNNASKDPRIVAEERFTENDYEGHRVNSFYVGGRRLSQRRRSTKDSNIAEKPVDVERSVPNPAQRVQSILGDASNNNNAHLLHPIFSQMGTLFKDEDDDDDELKWKQTARWVKFEEQVEEGGNRWSKPHVATLSLQALFELRNLLSNGNVMLNMEANKLETVVELICDSLAAAGTVTSDIDKLKLKETLLSRQKHQYEQSKKQHSNHSPTRNINKTKGNTHFMRKIPIDAEANNILVGEVDFLQTTLSCFIRLQQSSVLGNLTEVKIPTRFIFIILGPAGSLHNMQEIGRSMATLMTDEVFHEIAYRASQREHLLAGIDEFLHAVTVIPPGGWDPDIRLEPPAVVPSQEDRKRPLEMMKVEKDEEEEARRWREEFGLTRSGRLFGGLVNDVKRKAPWYWSDYKDALSVQSISSWIFLYFACLSPIITFGGMLSEATGRNMAAMETLVSNFVCGIIFAIFSGQPLNILGPTGPMLVFEAIIYKFCMYMGWDYMTFRFWIGIWCTVSLIFLTAVDASALVCYITRFTEESFALLIAIIFMYSAVENVLAIDKKFPVHSNVYDCICTPPDGSNATILDYAKYSSEYCLLNNGTLVGQDCDKPPTANVFLMSIILCAGTFLISIILKNFKNALFFPTAVRQYLSDFSVLIAIFIMTLLDFWMYVPTQKMEVPQEIKPTLATRGWLIPPFASNNPWWSPIIAFAPALLGTILIFMDQQITAVIVNRKEHKLKKGCGYHLDLFVLSFLIAICSFMGLPWCVASTVSSVTHVNSLKKESESTAPGEKPQFLGVREQRVTHILIFITVGLSVLLAPVLAHIPMPVLFGVFLYMGVSSLGDLQFFDRILIMFMPAKYQPDYPYLRQVPVRRVHLFTIIQLICLALLWVIKSFSQTSILFPLMLVVMVGIRKALDLIYTRRELKILDDIMPESTKRAADSDTELGFCQRLLPCGAAKQSNIQTEKSPSIGLLKVNSSKANVKEFEAESSLLKK